MESGKDKKTVPKRIGELLVAANVIRTDKLLEALQVSKTTKSPIGRTLMSMGQLTEQDLQAAIELQALLRAGLISTEFGIRALNVAVKNRVSLQQAFVKLGWRPPLQDAIPTSELGELLLEAGIVSPRSLEDAVKHSKEHGLPLGRCLVVNKALSAQILSSVLTAQVLLRDGKINKDQAVAGLKASSAKQQTIEQALKEAGAYEDDQVGVKLGELLCAAGFISESDKTSAVELGLEKKIPIGQVLVESGIIPLTVLEDCLKLQKSIASQSLTLEKAVEILKESQVRRVSVDKVSKEKKGKEAVIKRANQMLDFLLAANLLNSEQITAAQNATSISGASIGEVLLEAGLLDDSILDAATQAKKLVDDKIIDVDQAVATLWYCIKEKVEFHRALEEAPWDLPEAERDNTQLQEQRKSLLGGLWSRVTGKE